MNVIFHPIKVNCLDQPVCFWSDTHFGHECVGWDNPLWARRDYSSLQEHDVDLIYKWNESVTSEGIIFHLGDFLLGRNGEERFRSYIERLQFKELYLMPGNHATGVKQTAFTEGWVWHVNDHKRVHFVPNYLEVLVMGDFGKQGMALSHFPQVSWNNQARGVIHLHGHCHGSLMANPLFDFLYQKARIRDIGVEKEATPVIAQNVIKELRNRPMMTYDHH